MKIKYILILLTCFFPIHFLISENYKKPASISQTTWKKVTPYLLPPRHKIKKKLDQIFLSSRVTKDESSVQKAGFTNWTPGPYSQAIVSENQHLKGYFFKFYLDNQPIEDESKQWIDRAFEARSLQSTINTFKYQRYFIVPKKWIYVIPESPFNKGAYPKHFILVAKKIPISKKINNEEKWRTVPNAKFLKAFWHVLEIEGLIDSVWIHNSLFTGNNRVAFIDLEHHHKGPVPFENLTPYLSPKMQTYWNNLIKP